MRKKLLSQKESAEWVVCGRKGRGSTRKHKGPPGVWTWHSPRPCTAHGLALKVGPARDTPLLRKALQPRCPKWPDPGVRGLLHIWLARTFRPAFQPGMSAAAPPVLRASGRTHPSTPPYRAAMLLPPPPLVPPFAPPPSFIFPPSIPLGTAPRHVIVCAVKPARGTREGGVALRAAPRSWLARAGRLLRLGWCAPQRLFPVPAGPPSSRTLLPKIGSGSQVVDLESGVANWPHWSLPSPPLAVRKLLAALRRACAMVV